MSSADHTALLDQLQAQVNLVVCMLPSRPLACINTKTARADGQGIRRRQLQSKGSTRCTNHKAPEHAPRRVKTLPSGVGST